MIRWGLLFIGRLSGVCGLLLLGRLGFIFFSEMFLEVIMVDVVNVHVLNILHKIGLLQLLIFHLFVLNKDRPTGPYINFFTFLQFFFFHFFLLDFSLWWNFFYSALSSINVLLDSTKLLVLMSWFLIACLVYCLWIVDISLESILVFNFLSLRTSRLFIWLWFFIVELF